MNINLLNIINTITNIFNFIVKNWLGGLIGLFGSLIIMLIMFFATKKQLNGALCTILAIVFVLGGMFVNNMFVKDTTNLTIPSNTTQADNLNKNTNKDWLNTNGGFTFKQINTAKQDDECPITDDILLNINVQDYGSYVCFYYFDGVQYQNAVFLKTENGLVYDGLLMTSCDMSDSIEWYVICTFGIARKYDVNSFNWIQDKENLPIYKTAPRNIISGGYFNNLVSISSHELGFSQDVYSNFYVNALEAKVKAYNEIPKLLSENINDYFTHFDNVEMINTDDSKIVVINTFYNYLWEQMHDVEYNNKKVVDVSHLMCAIIPEDLRSNYPVSAEFKEQYPDVDFYSVYRCNIAIECIKTQGNKQLETNLNTDDYLFDNQDSDTIKSNDVEKGENFSKVMLSFNNIENVDLINLDLSNNPVIFTFENQELNKTKTLTINSLDKLNSISNLLLNQNTTWTYTIQSSSLIFDAYSGTIEIGENSSYNLNFDYTYLNNCVLAQVGLNAVGTVDTTLFDLSVNPVKIVLSNSENTYEFLFDSNDKLTNYQSAIVELGQYNYTILSDKLIFASTSGALTITMEDNIMLFNYAGNAVSSDTKLVYVLFAETSGKFGIDLDDETYSTIANMNDDNLNIKVEFYKGDAMRSYDLVVNGIATSIAESNLGENYSYDKVVVTILNGSVVRKSVQQPILLNNLYGYTAIVHIDF